MQGLLDAAKILGMDVRFRKLFEGTDQEIALQPWQVTGLAHTVLTEPSDRIDGIVADACGLGKKILSLSLIYLSLELNPR